MTTAHAGTLDEEGRRLLWRCRRGMKELDILLERYVRSQVGEASPQDRGSLKELLELPDPVLADYLFGHTPATEPHLARLVAAIRQSPMDQGRVGEYLCGA